MSLANYKWTSHLTWFSPLAPADKRTAINIMASISANIAPWNSDLEFRATVSFLHELVHYYQDVLSGSGHSDFLKNRTLFSSAFMWVKQLLTVTNKLPFSENKELIEDDPFFKYCYTEFNRLIQKSGEEFIIGRSYLNKTTVYEDNIKKYIQANFKERITIQEFDGFYPESIFEAEAVATVYLTIINLLQTDEQYEIFNRNRSIILPHEMDDRYLATINVFIDLFFHDTPETMPFHQRYETVLRILQLLVDIAIAFPPANMLENSDIAKMEFEPGVKLLRLLETVHNFSEENSRLFLEAYRNGKGKDAEKVILDACKVKYPQTDEIYSQWIEVFKTLLNEKDDVLIEIRLNSCQNRIRNSSGSLGNKDLNQLLFENTNIPVNFLTSPQGITSYFMNYQAIDKDFQKGLYARLMSWNRDIKFFDMFYDSGTFCCPLAEANLCAIKKESCKDIRRVGDIPNSHACVIQESKITLQQNSQQ